MLLHIYGKAETGEFLVLTGQTGLAKTASSGPMLPGNIRWTAPEEQLTSGLHGPVSAGTHKHVSAHTCRGQEAEQGRRAKV